MKKIDQSESSLVGRRRTLQIVGAGLATGGLLALVGCGKKSDNAGNGSSSATAPGQGCDATIDEQSKNTRKILQYNEPAAAPEKNCAACAQFEAGKYGDCGACKLFSGPVNPKGGCLSFAPKAGAPAPAKSG